MTTDLALARAALVAAALLLAVWLALTWTARHDTADNHVECILDSATQQQLDACDR